MIASVGMAVCKRAATPTALHVIAENSMTCIMSVTQSVRSAVMPQSVARRPTTTSTIGATVHAKAKPTATATAFCVYVIPL